MSVAPRAKWLPANGDAKDTSLEIVGRGNAVHRRQRCPAGERVDVAEMPLAGQPGDRAGRGIDTEHGLLKRIAGGDQQAAAVRRPGDRLD